MQQTLLCLLGVIVLGLYGLSRHEGYASREHVELQREIEVAALAVHGRWESHLRAQPFDETSETVPRARGMNDAVGLSPTLGPDATESHGVLGSLDDFDDFNGYSAAHPYPVRGEDLDFQIDIAVEYVQPWNPNEVSPAPTTAKRATLSVTYTPAWADSTDRPIGLTEVITVMSDGQSL